jgi:hypothetical protein
MRRIMRDTTTQVRIGDENTVQMYPQREGDMSQPSLAIISKYDR